MIILGHAGIVQAAKLRKIDIRESEQECVMPTKEYIRKVVEDVGEDEDFTCGSWISAVQFANAIGGIMSGDLTVTLKDLSHTIPGTIHHKDLTDGGYGKAITVGAALILHDVSMFSPKHGVGGSGTVSGTADLPCLTLYKETSSEIRPRSINTTLEEEARIEQGWLDRFTQEREWEEKVDWLNQTFDLDDV
ncbi:hypothetical protein CTI12_AA345930 [Artemisia annua]|uniref:Homologous recombination OB-fold protein OB-fold domain-containing protein n=1 Tax=Artemisia annua TaxID=35608 RepID=A0A2U1MSS0_ARTAN|nr:hypothetical protein CTI12_AA345930 [Artemisia annua]